MLLCIQYFLCYNKVNAAMPMTYWQFCLWDGIVCDEQWDALQHVQNDL